MPTAREVDANGFLTVAGCPISSFGIFDYGAGQVGLPGDPSRIVKVFRPESAVADPAAIESFKNVPFINDHEMLSGFQADEGATAPEDYGVSGVLTSNVYYEAPWMRGDLKIFARDVQADLASGKKDLSLGYSCDFEIKPGVFDGQAYEVVQTNLRGNHIALVKDARVSGARVLDGLCFDHLRFDVRPSDKEDNIMAKKVSKATMDNAVAQLKALLPALEQFLNEEGQEPAHQEQVAAAGGEVDSPVEAEAAAQPVAAEGEAAAAADPEVAAAPEDLPALIANVKAVLAKIEAMTAEPAAEPAAEPVADEDDPTAGTKQVGAAAVKDDEVNKDDPMKDKTNATDSSVSAFYADLAAKNRTYERLSHVVGAFDHSTMNAKQISAYGVKKLGIKCADGHEGIALDAYLNGIEAASRTTNQVVKTKAADAAAVTAELDAYLKGN